MSDGQKNIFPEAQCGSDIGSTSKQNGVDSNTSSAVGNYEFSPEEQAKVSEWSLRIRKKHSVPENMPHMIDRAHIDEYIAWADQSDFIFVYDAFGTCCKCSYGQIIYDLPKEYGVRGDNSRARVEKWKALMREKYLVPGEYEIATLYQANNEIDPWMAYCAAKNAAPAFHRSKQGITWFFEDGHQEYTPSAYEHFYSLNSSYKPADDGQDMSQIESDCFAHFLQIVDVIRRSAWEQHPLVLQSNMNQDGKIRADMPTLEQTVFALLYVRQLIGSKGNDDLLNTVCRLYIRHSSIQTKSIYVEEMRQQWNNFLFSPPMNVELAKIVSSNHLLLEIFQYGALFIHSPDKVKSSQARKLFDTLYLDKSLRVEALFALNGVMKNLFSEAANIAFWIQCDYAQWINDKKIPAPDVMWQQNLFQWNPIVEKKEFRQDEQPQFGSACNVEIQEVQQ